MTASPLLDATGQETALQDDARSVCLATSTASQDIKGTWGGTAYTVSQLALWRHNLAYSDTIRLYLYSDVAWTTGVYDSTALGAYTTGLFTDWGWGFTNRYFTPVASVKSFKITVAASAAAFTCARLYLGPYTEATINPNYGFVLTDENNAKQARSEGGSLRSYPKADWRSANFDMLMLTEADRAAWREIGRYCGINKSLVASLFPGAGGTSERDFTICGKFGKSLTGKLSGFNRYDLSANILEL